MKLKAILSSRPNNKINMEKEHKTNGEKCWCNPRVVTIKPKMTYAKELQMYKKAFELVREGVTPENALKECGLV
jgi:hypothetical protein